MVRLGLRPLREMERSAELIAAGNLTERVPGENEKTFNDIKEIIRRTARLEFKMVDDVGDFFGKIKDEELPLPSVPSFDDRWSVYLAGVGGMGIASATATLVRRAGAEVVGIAVLMELSFLKGRQNVGDLEVRALLTI